MKHSKLTENPTQVTGHSCRLPHIAEPTIEQVLGEFLMEQRKTLKPKTVSGYKNVIQSLIYYMNSYSYQALSKTEAAFYERHYNAEGKEHKDFCQLFGPVKLIGEIGGFLGDFMMGKVIAGSDFKRRSGTVTKKLSTWLFEKGYISEADAKFGEEEGSIAVRDLPRAEKAINILNLVTENIILDYDELADEDYYDYDHYAIQKIEPGKLWLEVYNEKGSATVGPITVPKEATKLLRKGWDIGCAIARIKGKWKMVEFASIYPV